ncbi:MAG: tRNA(His) guanylyltransferase Thg1 family protein [Lachnospiraceae bacterium]|nr:tRNA(His) guanylyltransferase Thg1 family protein [Lachnospiraceae bacterium]
MMKKDSLGDRMKNNYENRAKTYLVRRMPVIIRLDGKAFHTFTKRFKKPYDEIFHNAMNNTMKYLCENIQGCKLGYTQSDEITLLLIDYDTLTTEAWFNYNVQKLCSVAASMATMAFNKFFEEFGEDYVDNMIFFDHVNDDIRVYINNLRSKYHIAMFDARCFNIPESEVVNCFIWRQQDATRNAIQMLGQCHFSHKELHKKSCNDIQDMLMIQKGINFNDMPVEFKRGICCLKNQIILEPYGSRMIDKDAKVGEWVFDKEIPIFSQNREYIEDIMFTKVINEC